MPRAITLEEIKNLKMDKAIEIDDLMFKLMRAVMPVISNVQAGTETDAGQLAEIFMNFVDKDYENIGLLCMLDANGNNLTLEDLKSIRMLKIRLVEEVMPLLMEYLTITMEKDKDIKKKVTTTIQKR